jgi:hypothetical protein
MSVRRKALIGEHLSRGDRGTDAHPSVNDSTSGGSIGLGARFFSGGDGGGDRHLGSHQPSQHQLRQLRSIELMVECEWNDG